MDIQIKKAVRQGNSSAVILPRAWLNKEVRVELIKKTPEIILSETFDILNKYIKFKEIIGIYLVGSYARGEEDENSDIDVLVLTNNIDKKVIHEGVYSILIISSGLLRQKLKQDLFPVGQMIKEAEPLLNSDYLSSINVSVTKKNIRWYLETTEDKIKIIGEIIDKMKKNSKKYVSDKIAYTLVLRIRTLHIIKKLIKNSNYSKKDFIRIIKNISRGTNAYERYLAVKDNLKEKDGISIEETERLYSYLKDKLSEVKELSKGLR